MEKEKKEKEEKERKEKERLEKEERERKEKERMEKEKKEKEEKERKERIEKEEKERKERERKEKERKDKEEKEKKEKEEKERKEKERKDREERDRKEKEEKERKEKERKEKAEKERKEQEEAEREEKERAAAAEKVDVASAVKDDLEKFELDKYITISLDEAKQVKTILEQQNFSFNELKTNLQPLVITCKSVCELVEKRNAAKKFEGDLQVKAMQLHKRLYNGCKELLVSMKNFLGDPGDGQKKMRLKQLVALIIMVLQDLQKCLNPSA